MKTPGEVCGLNLEKNEEVGVLNVKRRSRARRGRAGGAIL